MKNPLISIIMSIYNEELDWIKKSIESIINQTYNNIEFIIVVDNPNFQWLDFLYSYSNMDKRIKIFLNAKNYGLVYSLNKAIKNTTGKYIARMDADDISIIDRLEHQYKYLIDNKLDLIGGNAILFNDDVGDFHETNKLIKGKSLKYLLRVGGIGIIHPTFFGKAQVFKFINGYNNANCAEDLEILNRIVLEGYSIGNTSKIVLNCRYSDTSITKKNANIMFYTVNYVNKNYIHSLKGNEYVFDDKYLDYMDDKIYNSNVFMKKQIIMGEARKALNNKKYMLFLYFIIKSIFLSRTTLFSLKVNIVHKILKFLEDYRCI